MFLFVAQPIPIPGLDASRSPYVPPSPPHDRRKKDPPESPGSGSLGAGASDLPLPPPPDEDDISWTSGSSGTAETSTQAERVPLRDVAAAARRPAPTGKVSKAVRLFDGAENQLPGGPAPPPDLKATPLAGAAAAGEESMCLYQSCTDEAT